MSALPKKPPNPRGSRNAWAAKTSSGGWTEYSMRKQAWIEAHPNASHREIDAAARKIAAELRL